MTFTATDASGNAASCSAKVTVVDTTPPEIDVVLNREMLWPPNHKLVEITAQVTVTDICDPNPTWVLTSITSSEPENDKGDGSTLEDIQEADYGTADDAFLLRSERDGRKTGRIYTITFTAMDLSGNTADAVLEVTVDHSQGAAVLAADGFDASAKGIQETAKTVTVLIPSIIDPDAPGLTDQSFPNSLEASRGESVAPALAMNAAAVSWPRIAAGNTAGVANPVAAEILDGNGDGALDLAVAFSAAEVQAIQQASDALDGPVGLHYRAPDGIDHLVEDLFATAVDAAVWSPGLPAEGGEVAPGTPTEKVSRGGDETVALRTVFRGIHPNPFNPQTTVVFELGRSQPVRLVVYNLQGAAVRTLVDGSLDAGEHRVLWNGRDTTGRSVASGVYFFRLQSAELQEVRKAVLLK